jgi:hypothetical protein
MLCRAEVSTLDLKGIADIGVGSMLVQEEGMCADEEY